MNAVAVREATVEACPRCGGFWLDPPALAALAPPEPVKVAIASARGRAGRCKGCSKVVTAPGPCPGCQRPAPACPSCGHAPMPIGNVKGVNLDVCTECRGIFFDAGELQLVAGNRPEVLRVQQAAYNIASVQDDPNALLSCSVCGRKVERISAFALDRSFFCARCCPQGQGAAPVVHIGTRESTVSQEGQYARRAYLGSRDVSLLFELLSRLFQ
jgi:Zn-finger nucleic acid-binding protein